MEMEDLQWVIDYGGGGYGGDKGGNSCRCRSSYADATLSKVHG